MVRRRGFYSFWRDFDEMMNEMRGDMESRVQSLLTETGAGKYLPTVRGEDLRVDVCAHEGEVMVVADLPGVEKENISLQLINPRLLEISAVQAQEQEAEEAGYYMRERYYGTVRRAVELPEEVREEDASATFKNGVLEVHLKKVEEEKGTAIPIE
ncbi:Hsp20/alpha crystallin family protein [Methanofollis formosanus]|uniref:Hsp20/alpha crystallin family protein n=1 Tax=Methanofollis formosanus TaxID=299308 RepID=A0A8G1EFF2_9EURY|nr:Hsp20/alpha crystallin family protein [Methanofollis formosanus]QYZ78718.1 Hsp20/alpha crystallin family protein [Methanofollis formosanus]